MTAAMTHSREQGKLPPGHRFFVSEWATGDS
jgi:hypothetical protein